MVGLIAVAQKILNMRDHLDLHQTRFIFYDHFHLLNSIDLDSSKDFYKILRI